MAAERDPHRWVLDALERYEGPLILYAARFTGDVDRARDVVQEAFLKLCRKDPGELEGRLAEWLYTVCRNLAFDVRKKERPMAATNESGLVERTSPEAGPGERAERAEAVSEVLEVLGALPANQQEVLRLKFQHGLSYKEISRVTELSVSNVGYLMHVGLKTLREKLAGAAAPELGGGAQ